MNPTLTEIVQRLRNAGFSTFSEKSYNPKRNAQLNLSGLTHYCDDGTLRFFHGRIMECSILGQGTILGLVESSAGDSDNTFRVYRSTFFDLSGTVIFRQTLENGYRTAKAARAEFWRIANSMDALEVTRAMVDREVKNLERKTENYRAIFGA